MGQPAEHGLRTCLLALALADAAGLHEQRSTVYELSLLRWIGCTAHAHELSVWFLDDIAAQARASRMDFGSPLDLVGDLVRHAGEGRSPLDRLRVLTSALAGGQGAVHKLFEASCEVASTLAPDLGAPPEVVTALGYVFARWDGKGQPGCGGDALPVAVRVLHVAQDAAVFHRAGGPSAAVDVVRRRAGYATDPDIAEVFVANADELLASVEQPSLWDAVVCADPARREPLDDHAIDRALGALADFCDLKAPDTAGHSRAVASVAADAAILLGLPAREVARVRRAALLHDIGQTGVANGVWEKPGPLSDAEWEQVRMHSYLTERILSRAPLLADLADIAALHHERLDGSGYHRRLGAGDLSLGARTLAAADVYCACREPRPYRPARSADDAERELRDEVAAGRLDAGAVNAVLAAAGHDVAKRDVERPAGLTVREVEVLALVARGHTTRAIAEELGISRKSADHHIQHIYDKIGARSRAAAALFASRHGLA